MIDHYLIPATPVAFAYAAYGRFLHQLSLHLGVHPRNLFLRGSCQIGFSITPKATKVWMAMDERSDLDLAIIDAAYYEKIDREVMRWEERTRADQGWGPASERSETGSAIASITAVASMICLTTSARTMPRPCKTWRGWNTAAACGR